MIQYNLFFIQLLYQLAVVNDLKVVELLLVYLAWAQNKKRFEISVQIQGIMQPNQQLKDGQFNIRQEYDNIINYTIQMTKHMDFNQRFEKAKSHIMDALQNRDARNTAYSPQLTDLYYVLYEIQRSFLWDWLTFLLSYCFIYLVILDNQSYGLKIILQAIILIILLTDTLIDFYCKSFDKLKQKNRYPAFYSWKALLIILMVADLIIFICLPCYNSRPIRPFRILRTFLPIVFDPELRRSLYALVSASKDIFVFIIYYTTIVVGFAFIGSIVINYDPNYTDPKYQNQPGGYDRYQSNFNDFSLMIMQIYTIGTYDNYPDNQTPSIQYAQANYIFYIVFIFLNMFLFVLIPGTIIYNKFRQNRSKYIIVDQIRQQHSLILAFVTLTQHEHNLSMQVLINFLFYFYRNKIRYVQYITQICLKLDDNNNQTIQVNQFMQLSKLIIFNSILYPPSFDDVELWIQFRRFINSTINLKDIVNHWIFQLLVSIYIILCFINTFFLLYTDYSSVKVFDSIFIWLFLAEVVVRIIAIGPQNHFSQRWNIVDSFLIILNIVFYFVTIGNNIDNLFKLNRIWRIARVINTIMQSKFISSKKIEILQQLKRLFRTFLQIMPIIVRFFLLYVVAYYAFSIFCMEIFYESQAITDTSNYSKYIQFSNFKTYIHSQYVMTQILTQASWSTLAYDYCWRNPDYYAGIIILFIFMHFIFVTVIGTLLKGIFWEIYFTVGDSIDQIQGKINSQVLKEEQNQIKTIQINQINDQLNQNQSLQPNTVIRREIIQKKLDHQIIRRIKNFQFYSGDEDGSLSDRSQRSISRSKIVQQIMQNWKISAKQLQSSPFRKKRKNSLTSPKFISPKIKKKRAFQFHDLVSKQQHDFQEEIEELLNKLILSNKIQYSQIIAYPKMFVQYLNMKFKHPQEYINADKFDLNLNPLYSEESINFHIYELHSILGIQSSTRQKKQMILQILTRNNLIDQTLGEKIFKNKLIIKKFHIDTHGALRKMYLSETNEDLVRKLQVQYFSDVYGNSFKQINKVTLQPLLKVEASLTYILWNILSYPQIDSDDFFHFLTQIEDQMSSKLLKVGSLVKFVYKINHESDIWFQVEHKLHQQTQIRFIKTGVWAYTQQMQENKIYYARDVFNWDYDQQTSTNDAQISQKYMKLFYQSFQTLAFSLIDKQSFFESNAKEHIYDLYLENFNIESSRHRSSSNHLRISSIMLVILSKQEERIDIGERNLSYDVSDIMTRRKKVKKQDFILDDADKQTFEKLKNLSAAEQQKIIESQGLPFSYILNLMKQLQDILKLHSQHFVHHVEKALNSKYNSIDNTSLNDDEDDIISLPQIVVNLQQ